MQQLKLFESVPFAHSALVTLLSNYKYPNDKISALMASGDIVKLKKGLYVNSDRYRSHKLINELIANSIYGPSYVSIDSALSYYGLIPEKVFLVQSLTTKRSRDFNTPIGLFKYIQVNKDYYSIDISQEITGDGYSFLIASPTKALCDKIVYTKKLSIASLKEMYNLLINDLRIDEESLAQMDLSVIEKCIQSGKKPKQLRLLQKTINKIKKSDVLV